MELKEEKVLVTDLKPGMYISRLDRPWLDTPFPLQGFFVVSPQDIDEVARHCKTVFVDVVRSKAIVNRNNDNTVKKSPKESKLEKLVEAGEGRHVYEDVTSFEKEMEEAKQSYQNLSSTVENVLNNLRQGGMLDLPALKKAINPMITSVVRNPDAYLWLARLKNKDSYSYKHAISTSIWAVAFGRHMGLSKKDIEHLALGCLLFDIGKTKIPEDILTKADPLTTEEFKLIKEHVLFGLDIVKGVKVNDETVVSIIMSHHERYDGSGYPRGLSGQEIPVFGRMAAIVDFYDAITSERPYGVSVSPSEAVKQLYELRDNKFQGELVEQFIQAIGLYPAGTIVELNSGEVGIVVAQNRTRRLRPKVMLVMTGDKTHREDFPVVDLLMDPKDRDGRVLEIRDSLEPGVFGIEADQYYL